MLQREPISMNEPSMVTLINNLTEEMIVAANEIIH